MKTILVSAIGILSLTVVSSLVPSSRASAIVVPDSIEVRGEILMVDCARVLVEASSRDNKDKCVVVYSGVFTGENPDQTLWSNDVKGNIAFAEKSSGVMNFVGKAVDMTINFNKSQILSVQAPD